MSAPLEFWFDFASTYSYLSALRIETLCRQQSIPLLWRPFLLGPIFKAKGWDNSPFVLDPIKGRYMWRDMERMTVKYGLPYQKPDVFPQNSLYAARIALAAENEAWLSQFIRSVYEVEFSRKRDISQDAVVDAALRDLRLDPQEWKEKASSPQTKAALRSRTEAAAALGIFGAPSFIVRGELFWGNDRLEDACAFALSLAAT